MNTFVTSDLHLGHANIIWFCNRPFRNVKEMNYVLIKNWNDTIKPNDRVYFLGDLSFRSFLTERWLPLLNGKITFIKGNHDKFYKTTNYKYFLLEYNGIQFCLTHYPWIFPDGWDSYIIHGHKHNNDLLRYPFFNKRMRFNVSTELTHYKPVNMEEIISVIDR